MPVIPILTADGSLTARHPLLGCLYHSDRGAMGEAMHIYIREGLLHYLSNPPRLLPLTPEDPVRRLEILDMGFGTGLNGYLTMVSTDIPVLYRTIEKYPLPLSDLLQFHHSDSQLNRALLSAPWNAVTDITPSFAICKIEGDILDTDPGHPDIVYWDAFDPVSQPELWTVEIFSKLFHVMPSGSVLVTYSAKGTVKQALRDAGFILERLPGALGKRHMIRAVRP